MIKIKNLSDKQIPRVQTGFPPLSVMCKKKMFLYSWNRSLENMFGKYNKKIILVK